MHTFSIPSPFFFSRGPEPDRLQDFFDSPVPAVSVLTCKMEVKVRSVGQITGELFFSPDTNKMFLLPGHLLVSSVAPALFAKLRPDAPEPPALVVVGSVGVIWRTSVPVFPYLFSPRRSPPLGG